EAVASPAERATPKPEQPPREFEIRIVDSGGKPVDGATVTCEGLSIHGGYITVPREARVVAKSGADGSVRVVFSPQMDSIATQVLQAYRTARPRCGGFVPLPE